MHILITPDVDGWAIAILCKAIMRFNPQFKFTMIAAPPRSISDAVMPIEQALDEGVDLWHAHYWNSAIQLLDLMPRLRDPKLKKILTHHNHYRLTKRDWKDFDAITEWTDWGVEVLKHLHPNVHKVTYGIDLDRFSYLNEYPPKEPAVGYIGRIVPWKNLGEITRVSNELGYKVIGSGFIDKRDYWETIDKSNLEFNGGVGLSQMAPANVKDDLYSRMTVFVMYSTEEKESGTLPLLEAMARGVPVMATEQGMARDIIKDGENGILFNEENFKEKLKMLMEDEPLRKKLREAAWQTIKLYPEEKMAREFAKLYHKVMFPGQPLISVIITTYNRPDGLLESILSIDRQSYGNKEIIVADDGSDDPRVKVVVTEAQKTLKTPIRFVQNPNKAGYDLGKIRNLAAMEALGSHLVIFEDRFTLDEGMLEKIVKYTRARCWGFGVKKTKDGVVNTKKSFLEGFSWILKEDLMAAGGFNERIDIYGGQSEELRKRFGRQTYGFNQFTDVVATTIVKASTSRKQDIWKAKLKIHKLYDHQ